MALGSHLSHTCMIARAVSTTDAYNARTVVYSVHHAACPCRLVTRTQQAPLGSLAERPVSTRYTLLVLPDTDLRVTDRICDVVFDDSTNDAGPFTVISVVARRIARKGIVHLSAELERVGDNYG